MNKIKFSPCPEFTLDPESAIDQIINFGLDKEAIKESVIYILDYVESIEECERLMSYVRYRIEILRRLE